MKRGTPDHPKTLWLMTGLKLSRIEVTGLLELLFHFVSTRAPQGNVGKWTNVQIARGVFWERDPDELVSALIDSGYFDRDKVHRLMMHDWAEHADQAVKKYLSRNHLKFSVASGRVRTKRDKDGHVRTATAVAVAQPLPEPQPQPPPAMEAVGIDAVRCQLCGALGSIRRSKFAGGGWYCQRAVGGCGQSFAADDPVIVALMPKRIVESVLGPEKPVQIGSQPEPDEHTRNAVALAEEFCVWLADGGRELKARGHAEAMERWFEIKGIPSQPFPTPAWVAISDQVKALNRKAAS